MLFRINMYLLFVHQFEKYPSFLVIDFSAEKILGLQGRELSVLSPWMRSEYLDIKPLAVGGGW